MEFIVTHRADGEVGHFVAVAATGRDIGFLSVVENPDGSLSIPAIRVVDDCQGHGVGKALIGAVYDRYQPELDLAWEGDHLVVGGRIRTTQILEGTAREWLAHNIPKLKER